MAEANINKDGNVIVGDSTRGSNSLRSHIWSQGSESGDEICPLANNDTNNTTRLVL